MAVIIIAAILGLLAYFFLGQNYKKKKLFSLKEVEEELLEAIGWQKKLLTQPGSRVTGKQLERFDGLIYYNLQGAASVFTADNQLEIFTDGEALYQDLQKEIRKAKDHIHILSYIIRKDEVLEHLEALLEQKIKEGVEVRMLADAQGSRGLSKKDIARLREKGIFFCEFFPALFGNFQPRINYRNHRKIIVIDGRTGYVGGFNIGREYLGLDPKMGYWRDTHLKLTGSAVSSLNLRFVLDWNYAAGEHLCDVPRFFLPKDAGELPPGEQRGTVPVQIVSSGPDSGWQNIRENYVRLIYGAKKYVYIQTPYFIPDQVVLQAIRSAALSGVDVSLMIPCKPDHAFVYEATRMYAKEVLEAGGRCFAYENGFLHAKGIVADGLVCCYGTANMDIRSFRLNFEVNAVIYDQAAAERIADIFRKDLKYCREVTMEEYEKQSRTEKLKGKFSRLLSPIL